jgi:hypothetical protein
MIGNTTQVYQSRDLYSTCTGIAGTLPRTYKTHTYVPNSKPCWSIAHIHTTHGNSGTASVAPCAISRLLV